jgi:hypothetical protein
VAGKTNILWQHSSGQLAYWQMNGTNAVAGGLLNPSQIDPNWRLVGTGDFEGQGHSSILWQHSGGWLAYWHMDDKNGTTAVSGGMLNPQWMDPSWKIVGTADLDGDGKTDILWQHKDGWMAYWYMDGTNALGGGLLNPARVDPSWKAVGPR